VTHRRTRLWGTVLLAAVAIAVLAMAASASARAHKTQASNPYNLVHPGTLTVGMNLQFKPLEYVDSKGNPAGYDVVLAKALAKRMHVKLKIQNIDFNGLIAGIVAKKFDVVPGLTPTPDRRKAVSFSRSYVPYAQILADAASDSTPATIAAWNDPSKTITSLQGSTAEQLVMQDFPKAVSHPLSDQSAAFLEVATGRANGIVVEDYQLALFNKSNGNKLKEVHFPKALRIDYGSYTVHKGNTALASYLNKFVCAEQTSGQLAKIYMSTFGAPLPLMPHC
jgi:ABC-type amino acid transport substrate-binding protein